MPCFLSAWTEGCNVAQDQKGRALWLRKGGADNVLGCRSGVLWKPTGFIGEKDE